MKYIFSLPNPADRFVNIEMVIEGSFDNNELVLQLPAWRPGRYELGNFAKNLKGFAAFDESGKSIQFAKFSKDGWKLTGVNGTQVRVQYSYYSNQPDAGACWVNHDQLYINPVHCCFFIPGRENEKCEVKLNVPANWKVATGMKLTGSHEMVASNFDMLADSPFIASENIQHAKYVVNGIDFNIWIQGECNPDWPRLIKDFEKFTIVQLNMMHDFPAKDFHFLIQVLPFAFYHGVEHLNSTVLALGPGYNLMKPALYNDLLGVASHELFHCWNVKSIRPAEMMPYDFTRENYASTGYVYEGITTYYGDLFLGRSGFFSMQEMLDEFSSRLQKHMDNAGRFNYSVSESSFDTWLDGYVPGVPGRKTSIYDEGFLLALILDFMIRSATDSKHSLDDVMRMMNTKFAHTKTGYTANDFREIAENVAGRKFNDFFDKYVNKASSLDSLIAEVVSLAGIELSVIPSTNIQERNYGIKTENKSGVAVITHVFPGSPAAVSGLMKDDEIVAVNNIKVDGNLSDLLNYSGNEDVQISLFSFRKLKSCVLKFDGKNYYNIYTLKAAKEMTQSQIQFRNNWCLNTDK